MVQPTKSRLDYPNPELTFKKKKKGGIVCSDKEQQWQKYSKSKSNHWSFPEDKILTGRASRKVNEHLKMLFKLEFQLQAVYFLGNADRAGFYLKAFKVFTK